MPDPAIKTVSLSSRRATRSPMEADAALPTDASCQSFPQVWLGARSAFGLALPDAKPTCSQLYAPRGLWLDANRLVVCDSGNHRVLIWNQIPTCDGQAADIVLGQARFDVEGPAQGCGEYERGMHLPTAAVIVGDRLLVADAWHHRILVWNQIPTCNDQRADYCLGQSALDQVLPNRGGEPTAASLYWPYGMAMIAGRFYVTDTGNRRILVWDGLPTSDRPADRVIGQPDACSTQENRGGPVNARSFRWPHAVAGDQEQLWIADAGNHRVLGWNHHPQGDCDANWLIGQNDMQSSVENPYRAQGERVLRFPYGLCLANDKLIVADTANNRVLFWQLPIDQSNSPGAVELIGQADFDHCGENRWQCVTRDSLCWPYGISSHGTQLAIADSGNNRVMLWDCAPILSTSQGSSLAATSCPTKVGEPCV